MINEFSGSEIEDEGEELVGGEIKQNNKSINYQRTHHATARKKRRGIIEKRRRDRINNSLSELRRMVPTAYEKQGSTKLEKAEILQLTVEHLKILQSAMNKGYFDDFNLRTDYKSIGFRECVSEVSRYFMTIEGIELQNPLRVRLMNHLQNTLKQKEAATAKSFRIESPLWPNLIGLNRNQSNNMATDLYANLQRHSPYSIPNHPAMVPMFSQAIMNKMIADQAGLNLSNGTSTKKDEQIKYPGTPFLFPSANLYQKAKDQIAPRISSSRGKIELPNFINFGHNLPVLNPLLNFSAAGNQLSDFPIPRIAPTAAINGHKQNVTKPHKLSTSSP